MSRTARDSRATDGGDSTGIAAADIEAKATGTVSSPKRSGGGRETETRPRRTRSAPAASPSKMRPRGGGPKKRDRRGASGSRQERAPRLPFVLLILGLLGGAFVSMLVLHTILAQDAFVITELQRENRELSQQEEALSEEVMEAEAPEELARRAEDLGMEPGQEPRFLDPETGEISGDSQEDGS